ncbi:hypothetical protein B0J11DRAFT_234555 [Dendryphion nanum]|uniref:Rhodopsin domain-containing protein n=1 Tax=Dendryphion nanum TaxID=256645 RepID=A0A9P9CZE1_9PLEO|nr:hypothetical protein B0J11DRAFT_234555 [Dendryphion nanum]
MELFPPWTNNYLCYSFISGQFVYALGLAIHLGMHCHLASHCRDNLYANKCQSCAPPKAQMVTISVGVLFDMIIYIWPMFFLYKLRMSLRKRIGLMIIFTVGIINVAVSCVRMEFILRPNVHPLPFDSGAWGNLLLTIVGPDIGIICASLPYLCFIPQFFSAEWRRWTKTILTQKEAEAGLGSKSHIVVHTNINVVVRKNGEELGDIGHVTRVGVY